jgi:hypothetical protein
MKQNCLTKQQIIDYLSENLPQKEVWETEKHLLQCDLCSEAIQGFALEHNVSSIIELENPFSKMTPSNDVIQVKRYTKLKKWMLAASILLLVSVSSYLLYSVLHTPQELTARQQKKQNTDQLLQTILKLPPTM